MLARHDEFVLFPESMLPHSKDEIKAAIVMALFYAKKEELDHLVGGYMMLADFVPDEEARKVNEFHEKWKGYKGMFESQESKLEFLRDEWGYETMKRATDESLRLADEANGSVKKIRVLKSSARR